MYVVNSSGCRRPLRGEIAVPGDKSISHRAVMFGSLAKGMTEIRHFLTGADCLSTISCFRKMGIRIDLSDDRVLVHGKGLHGLQTPDGILDCGNSGTTTRLLSGILAGQPFASTLTGDASIRRRPMNRVIRPLREMGANIASYEDSGCAPWSIRPSGLKGITYESPVASAQVKSCILLAGLYADSPTTVSEPSLSRDHTERMLTQLGAKLSAYTEEGHPAVTIEPEPSLEAVPVDVPGDISSAAYFLAATSLVPGSE
ncbi:MAG: 3-phosphoshikimate 1-carboxyvinyltransferase, partial [Eubacterium sp.]|nr:3-phosphoshikimate 1-carboxyvinyltransferase [Eubacterium sp.]